MRHIKYGKTLEIKKSAVESTLKKQGIDVKVNDTIGMENPYFYRNKLQYPLGLNSEGNSIMGVFAQRSHRVIETRECMIQNKRLQEVANGIFKFIKENSCFHMGWIAFVRSNIKGCDDKYINIKILLDYIRENYISVTDYQYCVESDRLIDKYVDEHSEIFEKAVSDFLDKQ